MNNDFSIYNPTLSSKSLDDLYAAIRQDVGLAQHDKTRLISQINGLIGGANGNTPLSALLYSGLGGSIGWLISRYFGMGGVGQAISILAGAGIGKQLNKQLNKPKDPYPGWKLI